jgi:maltose alpha-D-glucosyltransferase / alpha-amylase
MNSLLFSLPGTPVLYYGDEIGMGDNVYLGDRNGVRTPMQWNSDRNAGFSRADPARLYFPVIMDPVYGYESINVEAQERSPFSLLHWMKRMIALRAQHKVFGRGAIEFIRTPNRKVLTYVRTWGDSRVLCVANLSRAVQPVEIPLAAYAGLTPVEMLGRSEFPRIGDRPYLLTLAPYGFYWFELQESVVPMTSRTAPLIEEQQALPALFAGVVWDSVLDGSMRSIIEKQALRQFLAHQRWFGGKARELAHARFLDWATLRRGTYPAFMTIVEVEYRDGGRERYVLPLSMASGAEAAALEQRSPQAIMARIIGARKGVLYDGLFDDHACATLLSLIREPRDVRMRTGKLVGQAKGTPAETGSGGNAAPLETVSFGPVARTGADQSNGAVIFGWRQLLKLFRRVEAGPNPDVELTAHLTDRGFGRVPRVLGTLSYQRPAEEETAVAMLQPFISNQGSGWQATINELSRLFDRVHSMPPPTAEAVAPNELVGSFTTIDVLGRRTAELHRELSAGRGRAFAPEPLQTQGLRALAITMRERADAQLRLLDRATLSNERAATLARDLLAQRQALLERFDDLNFLHNGGSRIRVHGDYHLGQVLVAEADVVILDFEGEPARPLAERREKSSPLRDVAGMLRSFSYAALTALDAATVHRADRRERLKPWALAWERWAQSTFLAGYMDVMRNSELLPSRLDDVDTLLQAFVMDKAFYELGYELNNRPDWIHIPLQGLTDLARSGLRLAP